MNNNNYLTKFPVTVRKKKHDRVNSITGEVKHFNETNCYDFATRYGYFSINKANNINFNITLVDNKNKCNYIIKVAKSYLYDSLMLNLLFRPIQRQPDYTLHFNKKAEATMPEFEMNNLTPPEIKERFLSAKEGLEKIIENNTDHPRAIAAEKQMDKLISQQWKMELLYNLYLSEKEIEKESAEKP